VDNDQRMTAPLPLDLIGDYLRHHEKLFAGLRDEEFDLAGRTLHAVRPFGIGRRNGGGCRGADPEGVSGALAGAGWLFGCRHERGGWHGLSQQL
jgi:hypothetical protein